MFELATQEEVDKLCKSGSGSSSGGFSDGMNLLDEDVDKTLHIKGQMVYMQDWEQMLFLACPMMKDLNNLVWSGLFINDLSMHDYSRDIMLATTQEKIQMKMLLSAAESKAAKLEFQQKKLADVMKKSDDLISQMLPKQVADELAKGKSNEEICKAYECVTMLFSDIVTFTIICSKLKPIQVKRNKEVNNIIYSRIFSVQNRSCNFLTTCTPCLTSCVTKMLSTKWRP